MLYDFYGILLTDKQKEYMELYYREDYSLSEIADLVHVSRQAIYDNIKRTEQLIENYEVKLQLHNKFMRRQQLLIELQEKTDLTENLEITRIIEQLNILN